MNLNLNSFANKNKFLMLALDHRGTFKKIIQPENPDLVTDEEIVEVKIMILESLLPISSGVLLDPDWGRRAYEKCKMKNAKLKIDVKPYLLCCERTGYEEKTGERVTEIQYRVSELKALGAQGVKLLLYFNPYAKTALKQINTALTILNDCEKNHLPLFLELVTYQLPNVNTNKPELVVDSVEKFLEHGVIPAVFKLEYPGDPAACFEITKLLKGIPWILLTKGDNFEKFMADLKVAVENGATGFLAGRSLWQDFSKLPKKEWKNFFETTAASRLAKICEIVNNE